MIYQIIQNYSDISQIITPTPSQDAICNEVPDVEERIIMSTVNDTSDTSGLNWTLDETNAVAKYATKVTVKGTGAANTSALRTVLLISTVYNLICNCNQKTHVL